MCDWSAITRAEQNQLQALNLNKNMDKAAFHPEPPTPAETDVIPIDVSRPAEMVMADALNQVLHTIDEIQKWARQLSTLPLFKVRINTSIFPFQCRYTNFVIFRSGM